MGEQSVLHLGRVDVLPARDDHVLEAIMEEEVSISVQPAGIPGPEPAVFRQYRGGGPGLVPIAEHVLIRSGQNLAHLAHRKDLARTRVHDTKLYVVERSAS